MQGVGRVRVGGREGGKAARVGRDGGRRGKEGKGMKGAQLDKGAKGGKRVKGGRGVGGWVFGEWAVEVVIIIMLTQMMSQGEHRLYDHLMQWGHETHSPGGCVEVMLSLSSAVRTVAQNELQRRDMLQVPCKKQ